MADKRDHLRSIILSALNKGELKVGSKLPKESEMTQQYGVSRATVREGIATLVQDGILARKRRAGTFVSRLKAMPQSRTIAAIVAWERGASDAFDRVMWALEEEAHAKGFSLVLCNHGNDPGKIEQYVERLGESGVAGVIFVPIQFPRYLENNLKIVSRLEEKGIPFVLISTPISRETINRFSYAGSDGFSASRQIVRHLVGLGHRRIGYIRGFIENFTADERFSGFVEQMKQEGLEVPEEFVREIKEGPVEGQGQREIREILSQTPRPTAVVCVHDALARNVVEEVKGMGLKMPEELGVVGFDDLYFAATLNPPLTTVRVPVAEEGKLAADMLFAKINGEMIGERQEFLPCKLVVRRSCGAKPEPASFPAVGEFRKKTTTTGLSMNV